jgi:hypothetical protein
LVLVASSVKGQTGISKSELMEGILGLGPHYTKTAATVWAKMAADLPEPVFVVDLKFNGRGRCTFGEIPYRETNNIFWDRAGTSKYNWQLPITAYAIGGLGAENSTITKTKKVDFEAGLSTGCGAFTFRLLLSRATMPRSQAI